MNRVTPVAVLVRGIAKRTVEADDSTDPGDEIEAHSANQYLPSVTS